MTLSRSNQSTGIFPILVVVVAVLTACFYLVPLAMQSLTVPTVFGDAPPYYSETGDLVVPLNTTFYDDLHLALLPDPTFPSHALMRHGVEAVTASICNHLNYELKFYNPETKRFAFFCKVNNEFGIHIFDDAMNEITSFIKNRMKRVEQVIQYMKNTGYELIQ